MSVTLGLDLGPNSIGWALLDEEKAKILGAGVRVFPEGVENFDTAKEESKNEGRRKARTMRRQIARRARRKRLLKKALIETGLFPSDAAEQERLLQADPYELRTRALDGPLTLHEIGRVLLHLNQRRGFKSNKKEEAKEESQAKRNCSKKDQKPKPDAEKKTEDMLLEMRELEQAVRKDDARTIGEYLHRKNDRFNHMERKDDDHVRGRHILRKMLMDEFDLIWAEQSKHHPSALSDQLAYGKLGRPKDIQRPLPKSQEFLDRNHSIRNPRYGMSDLEAFGLFGLIFFHRTLKPVPKEAIGLCELEPKERRCPRADRRAQRFRLLQEVNNLRYIDPDRLEERELDKDQRDKIVAYLSTREKATFEDLRKLLGLDEAHRFNLERGQRSSIKGMVVDWLMAKAVGKEWHGLPEEVKTGVVYALNNSVDDDETFQRLTTEFNLDAAQANAALTVDLPEGYLNLSLKAINRLLPYMEQGLIYEHKDPAKSARAAAGYDDPWALRRRIFDKLPDPARTKDCPIGDIPNPVVKRTLVELRKLINAILTEHRRVTGNPKWRPDAVHVEMGRDVRSRPKDSSSPAYWRYKQEEDERKEREAKREHAKEELRKNNIPFGSNGRNILKYLLWEEQGRECIYSYPARAISFAQLFTEEIEIDHILPRSQSLDNSQMNLVVCFREENHPIRGKGQQTPRQWLESSHIDKYKDVCRRAKKLFPYPKYKRFLQKEAKLDDFIARQLNDTRYIAKATAEYLRCLFDDDENKTGVVLGLKGQLTSTLRRQWGLNTILSELPDSPAWRQGGTLHDGEKNRADHRHHAIDAIVLALTDRSRLQKLAKGFEVVEWIDQETGEAKYHEAYRGNEILEPWKSFREDVRTLIRDIKVSHRAERKVAGKLHDDNPFGPTKEPGRFVKRKAIESLSPSEVENICDGGIKKIVTEALSAAGIEFGRGKKPDAKAMKKALSGLRMPKKEKDASGKTITKPAAGPPIRRVRLWVTSDAIGRIREGTPHEVCVNPGSTHHLALFEWQENGKTKRGSVFVTMLAAMERVKAQQQEFERLLREHEKRTGKALTKRDPRYRDFQKQASKAAPLIERIPPKDHPTIPADAKFLFSLSAGEMVLANYKGEEKLLVFRTAASTQGQIYFVEHTDARRGKSQKPFVFTANTLNARKVTVDPIGRVRWAND